MYEEITTPPESFTLKSSPAKAKSKAETKEFIGKGIEIFISKEHRFGTDALLLAEFAAPRRKDTVCDLGTGCGIIPFLLKRDFGVKSITAIDIMSDAIELLKMSIEHNSTTNIIPINADIKNLPSEFNGTFDIVTCNPPYKALGTGMLSTGESKLAARHEVFCTIDDVCKAAYKLLKSGGKLSMINRAERLADVIVSMRLAKIEPKRLRFISKDSQSAPVLFLIEGAKDGKPFIKIEPPHFTHDGMGGGEN
jgi:tRNA1(Val) A37 N6-methylase TrmN6